MNVIIKKCYDYDFDLVKQKIKEIMDELDLLNKINANSKVFIKLNCVGPFDYSLGITTHPVILKAVLELVKEKTNNIIVGDNPATRDITFTLKKCGLYDIIMYSTISISHDELKDDAADYAVDAPKFEFNRLNLCF